MYTVGLGGVENDLTFHGSHRSRGMMTNWERIKKLAGPNKSSFPGGENVYLFCHADTLGMHKPMGDNGEWFRMFQHQAKAHECRAEFADTSDGVCLFVIVEAA